MFGEPANLWWLLLAVPVVLLHLYARRKQIVRVPSTLFWEQSSRTGAARRRKPRWNVTILMLLRVAALVLIVLAAAEWRPSSPDTAVVMVLDTSASMRMRDRAARSRLEQAKKAALNFLHSLPSSARVTLLVSSDWPDVTARNVSPVTAADRIRGGALKISRVPPEYSLAFAFDYLQRSPMTSRLMVYVGDGALTREHAWSLYEKGNIRVKPIIVGYPVTNFAVVNLSATRDPEMQRTARVFFQVASTSAQSLQQGPATVPWEMCLREDVVATGKATLTNGMPANIYLRVADNGLGGQVRIKIDADDDCPGDNVAETVIPGTRALNVGLLCRPENVFLRAAVRSIPGVRVIPLPRNDPVPGSMDVCISEWREPTLMESSDAGLLLFNVAREADGPFQPPSLTYWASDHPLLKDVDIRTVRFWKGKPLNELNGHEILARSKEDVWLAAREGGQGRTIEFGIDLLASDFAQRPDFPLFIYNAIHWLASVQQSPARVVESIEAIDPVRGPLASGGEPGAKPVSWLSRQPAWALPLVLGMALWSITLLPVFQRND